MTDSRERPRASINGYTWTHVLHAAARLRLADHIDGLYAAVDLDLLMPVLAGGRERTVAEYRRLLVSAGFAQEQVQENVAVGGMSLVVARPL